MESSIGPLFDGQAVELDHGARSEPGGSADPTSRPLARDTYHRGGTGDRVNVPQKRAYGSHAKHLWCTGYATSHRAPRVSRVPAAWLAEGGKGYRVTGGRALRRPLIQAALVTYVWRGPPRQVTCSRCLAVREDVPGGGARHHARMQTCHGGRGSGAVNGADETRPVALARAMVTGHQDNGSQDPSRVTPRSPHQNMDVSGTHDSAGDCGEMEQTGSWNRPGLEQASSWN